MDQDARRGTGERWTTTRWTLGGLHTPQTPRVRQKRTVEWEPVLDRPLTPIEQTLLDRVLERLEPVEFEPWWVQASFGFAVRF